MQRTLEQRRNNNQNNTDLLLSVYELTARSSLQIGQRPRQQSQSREKYKFKQCEPKKVDLMSISSPGSQKKLPLSPQVKLQSPREPGLIYNFIKAANMAIENNTDEKLIKTYLTLRTQIEMRLDALDSADILAVQFEKIKQENDTLRKKMTETMNSQALTNQAQLKLQLQKLEKKAESRKVCIKKLYQLLERNEKELELYKQGKKSAKTSFSKKNELNEILNGVYPKNKENIPDSYEPMLLQLIKEIDSKNFEALENLSKNSTNGDLETDRIILISNSLSKCKFLLLEQFKTIVEQKEDIVKFSVEICEKNQDLWKKFLEIDLTCQKQIQTLRQAISELETNIKSYYQFLKQIGHQSAQKFQEAYQFQSVIGDSIAKWLKQLGEIQEIINQRESDQYEFQQFQETLVLRLKEIMTNHKITQKENDFKGILEAINEKLTSLSEENSTTKQDLNTSCQKVKQQFEESYIKLKQEQINCDQQIKNWKDQYENQLQVHKDLLDKYENLQTEFNKQTQMSLTALQTKQQEISNLNEQTKKLKEDITRSQEIKLTYNEQKEQINQLRKEVERLNQIILSMQARSQTQEEGFTTIIEQNKSEITRLHQLIIDLHSQIEQFENQISLYKESEQMIKEKYNKDISQYQEKVKRFQEMIQNLQVERAALDDEYKQVQQQNIEFYAQQQQDQDAIDQLKQLNADLQFEKDEKTNEFLNLSQQQMEELKIQQEKCQKLEKERKKAEDQVNALNKEIQKQSAEHTKNMKILTDQQRLQEILSEKITSFEKLNEQNQIIINEQKRLLNETQIQLQKIQNENETLQQINNDQLEQQKNTQDLQQLELNQTKQVVLEQQELISNQQLLYKDSQLECQRYKKQIEQLEVINKSNQQELSKNIQDQNSLIVQLKSTIQQLEINLTGKVNQLDTLTSECQEKSLQIDVLQKEMSRIVVQNESNYQMTQQISLQIISDKKFFEQILTKKEIDLEKLQEELQTQQDKREKLLATKDQEMLQLTSELQSTKDNNDKLNQMFKEKIQAQAQEYEQQLLTRQSEIQKLTQSLRQLTSDAQQEETDKQIERQKTKEIIQGLENKIVVLDQKNKEMQQQSIANQELYKQLIQQLESLQKENDKESLLFKDQLHQKEEKIKFIETSYKIELVQLIEQSKQIGIQNQEFSRVIEKNQKNAEAQTNEIKKLTLLLLEKSNQIEIMNEQFHHEQAELEQRKTEVLTIKGKNQSLEQQIGFNLSQIHSLEEKQKSLTNELQMTQQQKDTQERESEKLVEKYNEILIALNQQENENQKLKVEIKQLNEQLQKRQQKIEELLYLERDIDNLNSTETKIRKEINHLQQTLSLREQQIKQSSEEMEQVKYNFLLETEKQNQEIAEKEQTNTKLLSQLSQQEKNCQELQKEHAKQLVAIEENIDIKVYTINEQLFETKQLLHQKQEELASEFLRISEIQAELVRVRNQNHEQTKIIESLNVKHSQMKERVESLQYENEELRSRETYAIRLQIEFEKINFLLQTELSISEVTEESILNALSQIKNEFQELLDKQSQQTMLIYQLYSQLSPEFDEDGIENQLHLIMHQVTRLIEIQERYEQIQAELGQSDLVEKIKELKNNDQTRKTVAAQNSNDFKSIEAYSQLLDGLLQEFLHNRVNLTMQSMKSFLTDQQRQNVNEYRRKIGELQNKLLQAEKHQKSMEDAKFSLQQYQQIVDKSEQKAMYYEMEWKKLTQQLQEQKTQVPQQRISYNDMDYDQEQSLNILNFSFRQEVLYGDNSFFGDFSQVSDSDQHKVCKQQILQLMEECQILQECVNMSKEDKRV